MKKGLIVYVTDSSSLPQNFEPDKALAHLSLSYDSFVLAASIDGFYDIPAAWHFMLTRGIENVSCVKARLDETGDIELYGEPLRLYG
ncbi:MAG: hypothetical protein JSU72_10005 [Deltaproteobacteria bacterium]|nr:MAG: hypothetical protein JSU72_10005 [Deltaproteobacteria bacterium]